MIMNVELFMLNTSGDDRSRAKRSTSSVNLGIIKVYTVVVTVHITYGIFVLLRNDLSSSQQLSLVGCLCVATVCDADADLAVCLKLCMDMFEQCLEVGISCPLGFTDEYPSSFEKCSTKHKQCEEQCREAFPK